MSTPLRIACFALAVTAALSGCAGKPKADVADEKLPPQVSLFGVRLQSWRGGELVSTGRAAKLTYDRSSGNFGAAESLLVFPSSQVGEVEVRALEATGNLPTRQLSGTGGIVAKAENGLTAKTNSATFDGVGLVASGKERIAVDGPGYALDADAFTFYFVTEELIFEGNVESRLGQAPVNR